MYVAFPRDKLVCDFDLYQAKKGNIKYKNGRFISVYMWVSVRERRETEKVGWAGGGRGGRESTHRIVISKEQFLNAYPSLVQPFLVEMKELPRHSKKYSH